MVVPFLIFGVLGLVYAVAALCQPATDTSSRFTHRDGQAACFAAGVIVGSSLVYRCAPEHADASRFLIGLGLPPRVAIVAGRRFIGCGLLTVGAGVLWQIAADCLRGRVFPSPSFLWERYSFPAVLLGIVSAFTSSYVKHYIQQRNQS